MIAAMPKNMNDASELPRIQPNSGGAFTPPMLKPEVTNPNTVPKAPSGVTEREGSDKLKPTLQKKDAGQSIQVVMAVSCTDDVVVFTVY